MKRKIYDTGNNQNMGIGDGMYHLENILNVNFHDIWDKNTKDEYIDFEDIPDEKKTYSDNAAINQNE